MSNIMQNFSDLLATRCMLVNLHLRQWSGRVQDKDITSEILEQKNAVAGSGRFWKHLVKDKLEPVHKYAGQLRNWVYSWSYSWADMSGDNGDHWRLCTVEVYDANKEELKQRIRHLKSLWVDFIENYESFVENDMKDKGGMAKRTDYPSKEILATKFDVRWNVRQVPVSGDFRVELADDEFAQMKSQAIEKDGEIVSAMIRESFARINVPLARMVENLSDTEKKFKNVTVTDIQKIVNLMRGFNVMNDPNITAICDEMEAKLTGFEAQELRDNPTLRKQVADDAKSIADNFANFF